MFVFLTCPVNCDMCTSPTTCTLCKTGITLENNVCYGSSIIFVNFQNLFAELVILAIAFQVDVVAVVLDVVAVAVEVVVVVVAAVVVLVVE